MAKTRREFPLLKLGEISKRPTGQKFKPLISYMSMHDLGEDAMEKPYRLLAAAKVNLIATYKIMTFLMIVL